VLEGGINALMERNEGNEENLPGSLQFLRGEHEEIQNIYRERRMDMPPAQVTMDVRKVSDKVSVIDVKGELTSFAEGVLMDAYKQASDGKVHAIVLNFEGLEYMNSSGIGLPVTLLIRINREKQRLLIYGLSEHYRSIFQITRLDEAIGINESEKEALRAAKAV
jgi:anti-sigma B factor antagonist